MHADFWNTLYIIRLSDCINCIKMFGSGWAGSVQSYWGVHEREGKKGGLKKGERWPQAWTPKIYDRSPPLIFDSWPLTNFDGRNAFFWQPAMFSYIIIIIIIIIMEKTEAGLERPLYPINRCWITVIMFSCCCICILYNSVICLAK